MNFLVKYGIGVYLLVTLFYKLMFILPGAVINVIFLVVMLIGILCLPFYLKVIYSGESLKVFWVFHLVNLLNFVHLMLFSPTEFKAILYFFTKYASFNLIILGLVYNEEFYKTVIVKYFKYVLLFMLVTGAFLGKSALDDGRLSIGYNSNDVGLFGLLGLFSIITFNKGWQKDKKDLTLAVIFLLVSLLSGSKAALLGIVVVGFLNWGITLRSVGMAALFMFSMLIMTFIGHKTALDRLESSEGAFSSREDVFRSGMRTFNDSPVFGFGLDRYGWANPKYSKAVGETLGPHNTYISIGIMYGAFFGIIFLLILTRFLWRTYRKSYKSPDRYIRFGYYFLLLIMVNGFFETLIVGVNEFVTLLYWFFIGTVSLNYFSTQKLNHAADH
ncbi:O-antigen ligase family protein [Pedobacter sp. MC2016-14]|uniref:O-antigen ligase family protein n=1 Tax=Pedobacter sp. MC2016-14 TaxID=2897327 RepID=UPI001E3502D2|nr:O-antigen ligase family protein [Pedobacter sp. MC2016-14]MCD0486895.1 O-antigen ligase family protein [Pedobacter sp. MC2016-14]